MHFSHDELITATPQGLQSQMSVFLNTIPSLAMAVRTWKKRMHSELCHGWPGVCSFVSANTLNPIFKIGVFVWKSFR